MKLKQLFLISLLFLSAGAHAQWLQKANFTGISRAKSTAFTINNKIYVLGGVDNSGNILNDFWEYDIATDSWLQKPAFPGPERYGAVSFVINGLGYVATGGNNNGYLDDLWEYNPVFGSWNQKTGLPVTSPQHDNQRTEAWSFVIGNKAYVGGGNGFVFGANQTWNIAFPDAWEYDPATNNWTQKTDIPDIGKNMSVAVAINNKGYVGLGCDVTQTVNSQHLWEYDPLANTWTAKTDFPTAYTTDAGAFVYNSFLYVAGGVTLTPVGLSNQFYKYDPVTDSWTLRPVFTGGAIAGAFVVSTGTSAFMGTGYNSSIIPRHDLWEFTPVTAGIYEQPVNQGNLSVYPNPSSGNFMLTSSDVIKNGSVEVFNPEGKRIFVTAVSSVSKMEMHLDAAPGIYFLKVVDGVQQSVIKLIISGIENK